MSVFIYTVSCNSALELVVGKVDNTAINNKGFFAILINKSCNWEQKSVVF